MKQQRRFRLVLALMLVAALAILAGCGQKSEQPASGGSSQPASGSGSAPAAQGDILVGVPVPLTGANAKMGEDELNAIKMAAEEINAAGGINGRMIKILSEDDACDAQTAVQAANKLVAQGIVAAVGHYCSGAALPASTVFHNAGVPIVLVASTATKITQQGYAEVFRVIPFNQHEGVFVANYAKEQGYKRIAYIHDNTAYGKDLAEQARMPAEAAGLETVLFEAITPGEKDFKPVLTKLKSLNPDFTFFTGYYSEGGILVKQAKEIGVPGVFTVGDANNDVTFIEIAGQDAEGTLVANSVVGQNPEWAKKYKEKYGIDHGPYSNFAYDGMMVLADAMKRAKEISGPAIVEALKATDYEGLTGRKRFDEKGDVISDKAYQWLIVKDGKFQEYYTPK